MSISKIKLGRNEFELKIKQCCDDLGIKSNKILDRKDLIQFELIRGELKGILRVYETKKGMKCDETIFKDTELYKEFENHMNQLLDKVKNKKYTYHDISDNIFDELMLELRRLCNESISINDKANNDSNKSSFFLIKNSNTKEEILISRYKNGSLLLDGDNSLLWTDICNIIDSKKNYTPLDIFDRIVKTEKISINDSEYPSDDYSNEITILKEKLTDKVFVYLDEHFQNYLISAQRLVESEINLPEYNLILCPVAKVLEGYLKRLLVDLNIETYDNIESITVKNWNFGNVFNGTKCIRKK